MNKFIILLLVVVGAAVAKPMTCGVVVLRPHDVSKRNVTGELTITQNESNGPVHIIGNVYGLTEGLHGFHVHEKGDLRQGCTSAAAHFNPKKVSHGAPDSPIRHVGDLGNIQANANGVAVVDITDNVISLSGPNSILGRAIVVHADEDDLGQTQHPLSMTTGNAGDRWACGIIGLVQ
ncbi:superoxide dismutase [Cu-Zn], chloroplastic-like isoform X2 [Colletes gigas]|uniref:superoxide dismutase [Cu-Zn], chloroplastic-like isoform X2 n=1 Tax=Colletes gigas TaxID=935657 RepID=UPI001C9B4DE8|nr:superoxide dismutase [Cu-Zn], chloroplastic-like isoform X2 [Colletes gigas]